MYCVEWGEKLVLEQMILFIVSIDQRGETKNQDEDTLKMHAM